MNMTKYVFIVLILATSCLKKNEINYSSISLVNVTCNTHPKVCELIEELKKDERKVKIDLIKEIIDEQLMNIKEVIEYDVTYSQKTLHKKRTLLHIISLCNYDDSVKELLKKLIDEGVYEIVDEEGKTALHRAANLNNYQFIKILLDHDVRDIPDNKGKTALYYVAKNYYQLIIYPAIKEGKSKDWTGKADSIYNTASELLAPYKTYTRPIYAGSSSKTESTTLTNVSADLTLNQEAGRNNESKRTKKELIAYINGLNDNGQVPEDDKTPSFWIFYSVVKRKHLEENMQKHVDKIKRLFREYRADLPKRFLYYAVKEKHEKEVKAILKNMEKDEIQAMYSQSTQSNSERSPLYWAVKNQSPEMLHLLIYGGIEDEAVKDMIGYVKKFKYEENGQTLLHLAASLDNREIVEIIVEALLSNNVAHDASCSTGTSYPGWEPEKYLDLKDNKGNTPLHLAAQKGCTSVVRILLEKGANPEIRNHDNKTAKDLAKGGETQEVIASYILKQQVDATSHALKSHLTKEHLRDEFERISVYLEENKFRANSIIDAQNHTFLYYVVKEGLEKTVRILVENEEKGRLMEAIHANNDYEHSPLYLAVQNGNFEIVKMLIYGRVIKNYSKSIYKEDEMEGEVVDSRGAAVKDLRAQDGQTLLHVAVSRGYERIVRLLVEFMAIAAEQHEEKHSKDKNEPLYRGQMMGELAYVIQGDNYGTTSESLARDEGFTAIADFLKKVKEDIEKRRINLDEEANIITAKGGGGSFTILGSGASGQGNTIVKTQEFAYKRNGLIIETRKIWRDKNNRLWQKLGGNDSEEPASTSDESILNQQSREQQEDCLWCGSGASRGQ